MSFTYESLLGVSSLNADVINVNQLNAIDINGTVINIASVTNTILSADSTGEIKATTISDSLNNLTYSYPTLSFTTTPTFDGLTLPLLTSSLLSTNSSGVVDATTITDSHSNLSYNSSTNTLSFNSTTPTFTNATLSGLTSSLLSTNASGNIINTGIDDGLGNLTYSSGSSPMLNFSQSPNFNNLTVNNGGTASFGGNVNMTQNGYFLTCHDSAGVIFDSQYFNGFFNTGATSSTYWKLKANAGGNDCLQIYNISNSGPVVINNSSVTVPQNVVLSGNSNNVGLQSYSYSAGGGGLMMTSDYGNLRFGSGGSTSSNWEISSTANQLCMRVYNNASSGSVDINNGHITIPAGSTISGDTYITNAGGQSYTLYFQNGTNNSYLSYQGSSVFSLYSGGTLNLSTDTSTTFYTNNGSLALTLDTSQNANFTQSINLNDKLHLLGGGTNSGIYSVNATSGSGGVAFGSTGGNLIFKGGTTASTWNFYDSGSPSMSILEVYNNSSSGPLIIGGGSLTIPNVLNMTNGTYTSTIQQSTTFNINCTTACIISASSGQAIDLNTTGAVSTLNNTLDDGHGSAIIFGDLTVDGLTTAKDDIIISEDGSTGVSNNLYFIQDATHKSQIVMGSNVLSINATDGSSGVGTIQMSAPCETNHNVLDDSTGKSTWTNDMTLTGSGGASKKLIFIQDSNYSTAINMSSNSLLIDPTVGTSSGTINLGSHTTILENGAGGGGSFFLEFVQDSTHNTQIEMENNILTVNCENGSSATGAMAITGDLALNPSGTNSHQLIFTQDSTHSTTMQMESGAGNMFIIDAKSGSSGAGTMEIEADSIGFLSSGQVYTNHNVLDDNSGNITCSSISMASVKYTGTTSGTASVGGIATVPTLAEGFIIVYVSGSPYKVPFFAN